MIFVSASSLRDYFHCPRKLYHRINKTSKALTASLIVGIAVHDVIDANSRKPPVIDFYHDSLVRKLSSPLVTFYRGQTIKNLLHLFDTCWYNYLEIDKRLPGLLDTEQWFDLMLDDDVKVVGKFDQIRKGNTILELKSSKREPSDLYLAADLQATLYTWAYRETYRTKPTYYYAHLFSGSVYEIEEIGYDDLFDNIEDFIKCIRRGKFTRQTDGYRCDGCEYKERCVEPSERSTLVLKAVHHAEPRKLGGAPSFAKD